MENKKTANALVELREKDGYKDLYLIFKGEKGDFEIPVKLAFKMSKKQYACLMRKFK